MKKTFTLLTASILSFAFSFAQTPISLTYSHSQDITNSLACGTGDNNMYRYFILSDFTELTGQGFTLEELEFAIGSNANAVGTFAEINIFKSTSLNFPLDWPAAYELIYTTDYTPTADDLSTIVSVEIENVVDIPDSHGILVMFTWDIAFLIGDNDMGEDRPTYLSSITCSVPDPTPTEDLGFPAHAVINLVGSYGSVGVADFTEANISLYPNPAIDRLNISLENNNIQSVIIRDIKGKIVENIVVDASTVEVNVSGFATGMYLVEVQSENGKATQKFVKK